MSIIIAALIIVGALLWYRAGWYLGRIHEMRRKGDK